MMDASNLSGVAHDFSQEVLPAIWEEVLANGGGTRQVNHHPLSILWTMKMVDLAAGECLCSRCIEAFRRAYEIVKAKAAEG